MTNRNERNGTSRRSVLRRLGIAGSGIALSTGSAASTLATPARDIERYRDLTYVERPAVDHQSHSEGELRLDLYLPDRRNPHPVPVLVYIHGGMWMFGTKDGEQQLFEHFAREGIAVASIEYRFISEAIFPAQIRDVNTAIRWLRAHADEYGLDPDAIGTWGTSAGGHLAVLTGVTNGVDEFEGDGPYAEYSSDVQAAASWYGIMALHEMAETAPPESDVPYEEAESPESQLVGEPIVENPEAGKYASPIEYLDSDDPPLLLYHGTEDELVGDGQSERMFEAARERCHDTTYYALDSLGHSAEEFYSALTSTPPAAATVRTVYCGCADTAQRERTKTGPIASLSDMERFFRRNLRTDSRHRKSLHT